MAILITILMILFVYVIKFSSDFNDEDVQKVAAFVIGIFLIYIVFKIITN